ncbi:WAT1-related protein [Tripterygium wilfordii]|uniref:WAT1-related protein n=1 Tax=Tripterygium wilfordii TaxID=458696 RepID=A0A7J7DGJ0_TRIWF|nr:WAT1-related protein At5g64700 [Tripterygium wilfordii]KAF5745166.1 WAT1-related protein [Tripterygium wilfordii]
MYMHRPMDGKKPYLVVILVQSIYTGMFLLSKAAFNGGMNNFVFVFYRQAVSTIFLAPIALVFEWKNAPPLCFRTFLKIFMLSLLGITSSLDLYGVALVYTSATLAAATTNCLPVITFLLALVYGMESLKLRTKPGMAKLAGILVCLAGTATLAFYKGPHFQLLCHHHLHNNVHVSSGKSWIKGVFIMLTSNTFFGLWLVLQTRVLKTYPSILLFTTLQCLSSTVQSFVVAIAFVRDPYEWRLGWNVRLVAVAYSGVMVTGVSFYLQSWVVEKKGPVFLAMSTPLALIFTTLSSAILLCEIISLGSILGGILLVAGLYSVLWAKSKEQKIIDTQNQCLEADKAGDQDLEQACK